MRSETNFCWVNFKYEGVPTFCFICGMTGHGEKLFETIFETPMEQIEKSYGIWMRAQPRRKSHTIRAKWLRPRGILPTSLTVRTKKEASYKAVTAESAIEGDN